MKTKLNLYFFFCLLPLCVLAQTAPKLTPEQRVEELKKKKHLTLEDFEHENPGCPENSDCTPEMGKQRKKWLEFIKLMEKEKNKEALFLKKLENFRAKEGIPVVFYTNSQAFGRFAPIVFESSCGLHNPKKKEAQILMGEAFFKSMKDKTGHIRLMNVNHDIPYGELLYLDPVYIYDPKKPDEARIYYVPKGEKPIYMSGKEATIVRDENGFYYGLNIGESGDWKITAVKTKQDLKRDEYSSDTTCIKNEKMDKFFGSEEYKRYYNDSFCQTIYDTVTKQELQMRLPWSC